MRMLSQIISGAIDGIIHREFYNGYLIMHNMKYFATSCVINFGIFSQQSGVESQTYAIVDYGIDPTDADAHLFYMFLVL